MKTKHLLIVGLSLITCLINPASGQEQSEERDALLWKQAQRIHQEAVVFDAHAHKLVIDPEDPDSQNPEASQLSFEKVRKGGIDGLGLYFAYYPIKNGTLLSRVQEDLERLREEIVSREHPIAVISEFQNLPKAIKSQELVIIPGVEYFFGALNGDLSAIDSLHESGIRTITLMNNQHDVLSEKSGEPGNSYQLTEFGKKVIDKMNKKGMVIDISHLSDPVQMNVINHSQAPVIASHSSVRGVHDVPRNIPDSILIRLSEKGGAVMITFNSGVLAGVEEGRCNPERLIDHIDHAVQIAGTDHVGIGSDYNGAGRRSPRKLEDASGFPWITYHLLKRGYSEDAIRKILGKNYLKTLEAIKQHTL
jgi:membrane dipeptidase